MPSQRPDHRVAETESRMDAIRLKQMLGGALTDQERMCLQIEANGFGCTSSRPQSPARLPAED